MSELKAFVARKIEDGTCDPVPCVEVYLKSEADKVIAGLDWRIADGDRDFEMANHQNERLLKIVRHHKFKRCLDKAKICQLRLERYEQYVTKYKDCNGPGIQRWRFLKDHYEKWYMRWIKIADQFNPNLTATKENNNG